MNCFQIPISLSLILKHLIFLENICWYDFIIKELGPNIIIGLAGNKTDLILEDGYKEEITVFDPIMQKVVNRNYTFQLSDLLQAISAPRDIEADISFE